MNLFIILGNQLFPLHHTAQYKDDTIFFMAEDYGLCKHLKPSKKKILLFLSAMRSYADKLSKNGYDITYLDKDHESFEDDYIRKLDGIIREKNIKKVYFFEIEDKFFENNIKSYLTENSIIFEEITSPMFLNTRSDFKDFLSKNRPQMASFYKMVRIKMNLLIDRDSKPVGGKWSFDSENRKKIPASVEIPKYPEILITKHTSDLKQFVEQRFSDHHGSTDNFKFATTEDDVDTIFDFFLHNKLNNFGDYEDAVTQRDNILFHSTLSTYMNLGLITPTKIVDRTMDFALKHEIKINSLEGFIRQIIGWREFIRGIYQNFSDDFENRNFFQHDRSMKSSWYSANTGLDPLDHAIKNAFSEGWSHHIERLMILSNIMNLCEINPTEVHNWFMEAFVDSSDWVMGPNVYGMGLFSDGGIFATKPYICGSNYVLKMMDFKKGDWCEVMDGLYWRFINKHRDFFSKNPRLSLMVSSYDKMDTSRRDNIVSKANEFIENNTTI